MGWTCTYKPAGQSVADFFHSRGSFSWSEDLPKRYRILDTALIRMHEFYAALEVVDKATGDREVVALVFLVKMFKTDNSGFNFCFKDMDETMGPNAAGCPERILKLLTPTSHANVQAWRALCWKKVEARQSVPRLRKGVVMHFAEPINFPAGPVHRLTVDSVTGQKIFCTHQETDYQRYLITRTWLNRKVVAGQVQFA